MTQHLAPMGNNRMGMEDSERFISIQSSGVPIAEICLPVLVSTEEINANARLIAAAPELLEVLESVAEELEFALSKLGYPGNGDSGAHKAGAGDGIGGGYALNAARAAIAKARGQE